MGRQRKYNSIILSSPRLPGLYPLHKVLIDMFGEDIALEYFLNEEAEHMVFLRNVTEFIDEYIFDPMYQVTKGPGRPGYSPRALMAFMICCESMGISAAIAQRELITNIRFKMAIGLNYDSDVFCYKTFYNFKLRLLEYYELTGIDLVKECFSKVTQRQIQKFGVDASHVRVDSKYFDSNIKLMSRYEIVLATLQKVLKEHPFKFTPAVQKEVDKHMKEEGAKTMYGLKNGKATYNQILTNLGHVVRKVIDELVAYEQVNHSETENYVSPYSLLYRVFGEQYELVGNNLVPIEGEKISTDSVQNPHDPDAAFRDKRGKYFHGYVFFGFESFGNKAAPDLVLDYQVEKATFSDQKAYIPGVKGCEKTSGQAVTTTSADHAFKSDENSQFNLQHLASLNLKNEDGSTPVLEQWVGKMGGKLPRFDLILDGENLKVIDRETDKEYIAEKYKDRVQRKTGLHIKRWRAMIENEDGQLKEKLFLEDELKMANLRREIENIPIEHLACRNNVEATMFQAGYTADGCQTRFRGLFKHKLFFGARVMWMNFRRIYLFLKKKSKLEKQEACRAAV